MISNEDKLTILRAIRAGEPMELGTDDTNEALDAAIKCIKRMMDFAKLSSKGGKARAKKLSKKELGSGLEKDTVYEN